MYLISYSEYLVLVFFSLLLVSAVCMALKCRALKLICIITRIIILFFLELPALPTFSVGVVSSPSTSTHKYVSGEIEDAAKCTMTTIT